MMQLSQRATRREPMGRAELVEEARLQTRAIQRLGVWLRLGCSLAAIGAILAMWGSRNGQTGVVALGVACLVLGAPLAAVLKLGVTRARRNVERILAAAGVELGAGAPPSKPGRARRGR